VVDKARRKRGKVIIVMRRERERCYDVRGVPERLEFVFLVRKRCGSDWARKCGRKRRGRVANIRPRPGAKNRAKTKEREKEREMEGPRKGTRDPI